MKRNCFRKNSRWGLWRGISLLGAFLLLLAVCVVRPTSAAAAQDETETSSQFSIESELEDSGAAELYDQVPEEGREGLAGAGVEEVDPDSVMSLGVGEFFKSLWNTFLDQLKTPVTLLATLIGVVLLCSLLSSLRTTMEDRGVTKVFSVVSLLAICGVMIAPVTSCMTRCAQLIEDCSRFLLSFIPVFTSVMAVSGKTASSAMYQTFLFGAVQVVSQIASTVLVPLLAIYLAFCLVGSVSDHIQIGGIASAVKSTVVWALGFLLTIFVGILSFQGIVANSADTVATKAAKFVLGTTVPVVGGALSEAFNSVQGCMGLLKSTVGVFGILACVFTFLPMILNLLLMIGSLKLSAGVAELMQVDRVPGLLKAASAALSLMLSILLCFALLMIISTTMMLLLGGVS